MRMDVPTLVPVEYRDGLAALVSAKKVHIVAPWLLVRPAGDPELRFLGFMCLCAADRYGPGLRYQGCDAPQRTRRPAAGGPGSFERRCGETPWGSTALRLAGVASPNVTARP